MGGCIQVNIMKPDKRLKRAIEDCKFDHRSDGLPSNTKIVGIRFYKGRPYYGKIVDRKDEGSDSAK